MEREIQRDIREALGQEPDLVLWRNNVGVAQFTKQGRKQTVAYGLAPGSADLVGILAGRFFALEVKTATGRASEEQRLWLNLVRAKGGFAAIVRSVDEARAALGRAREGASE